MAWGSAWRSLGVVILVAAAAIALASDAPDPVASREADKLVVGDLKLADGDEGPSDGVESTFSAGNLAPGDTHRAELSILRESILEPPPTAEPRVTVTLHEEHASSLGQALEVTELTYGAEDLLVDAQAACGQPVRFAELLACTHTVENPLANLSDPTGEGRVLGIEVRFAPEAGNELSDERFAFTVEVELHADTVERGRDTIDDARARSNERTQAVDGEEASLELASKRACAGEERLKPAGAEQRLVDEALSSATIDPREEHRRLLVAVLGAVQLPSCPVSSPLDVSRGSVMIPSSPTRNR